MSPAKKKDTYADVLRRSLSREPEIESAPVGGSPSRVEGKDEEGDTLPANSHRKTDRRRGRYVSYYFALVRG